MGDRALLEETGKAQFIPDGTLFADYTVSSVVLQIGSADPRELLAMVFGVI